MKLLKFTHNPQKFTSHTRLKESREAESLAMRESVYLRLHGHKRKIKNSSPPVSLIQDDVMVYNKGASERACLYPLVTA